jgi:DNA-directed RNA polymerase subunit M/transcription elongation factor TFIIS
MAGACPSCGGALVPQSNAPAGAKRFVCEECRTVVDAAGRRLLTGTAAPPSAPPLLEG